jgi:hypothetical protein
MQAANRFKIERHPDHFIFKFGVSAKEDSAAEFGDEVVTLMVPLTCATVLAVAIFEETTTATGELQRFYEALQPRIAALNARQKAQQEALAAAAQAKIGKS